MILALLTACVIGGDKYPRPRDLEADWFVDRLRLLAIAAEPPEVKPGELVSFEALFADPNGELALQVWTVCPPDVASDTGCSLDFSALEGEPTAEELAALGVIAIQPPMRPVWTPGPELLDGLSADQRAEGVYATVQVAAFPASALEDPDNVDFGVVDVGYKRLVVSDAATPNHNPAIAGFRVDGNLIPDGATVELAPGERFVLTAEIAPESIEDYTYINLGGVAEPRTEDPYALWYASGGALAQSLTLQPTHDVSWTSPDAPGDAGWWWVVVRDRRGGFAWRAQAWATR